MSRTVTRILCADVKDRHIIGEVCADSEGLLVSYTAEVWHPDKVFGSNESVIDRLPELADDFVADLPQSSQPAQPGSTEVLGGYCKGCNRPAQLNVGALRQAALTGAKEMRVPFTDTADKVWVDAGYAPLYSPDIRRERHDPR